MADVGPSPTRLHGWFITIESPAEAGDATTIAYGRRSALSPTPTTRQGGAKLERFIMQRRLDDLRFVGVAVGGDGEEVQVDLIGPADLGRAELAGVPESFIKTFRSGIPPAYEIVVGIASSILALTPHQHDNQYVRPGQSRPTSPCPLLTDMREAPASDSLEQPATEKVLEPLLLAKVEWDEEEEKERREVETQLRILSQGKKGSPTPDEAVLPSLQDDETTAPATPQQPASSSPSDRPFSLSQLSFSPNQEEEGYPSMLGDMSPGDPSFAGLDYDYSKDGSDYIAGFVDFIQEDTEGLGSSYITTAEDYWGEDAKGHEQVEAVQKKTEVNVETETVEQCSAATPEELPPTSPAQDLMTSISSPKYRLSFKFPPSPSRPPPSLNLAQVAASAATASPPPSLVSPSAVSRSSLTTPSTILSSTHRTTSPPFTSASPNRGCTVAHPFASPFSTTALPINSDLSSGSAVSTSLSSTLLPAFVQTPTSTATQHLQPDSSSRDVRRAEATLPSHVGDEAWNESSSIEAHRESPGPVSHEMRTEVEMSSSENGFDSLRGWESNDHEAGVNKNVDSNALQSQAEMQTSTDTAGDSGANSSSQLGQTVSPSDTLLYPSPQRSYAPLSLPFGSINSRVYSSGSYIPVGTATTPRPLESWLSPRLQPLSSSSAAQYESDRAISFSPTERGEAGPSSRRWRSDLFLPQSQSPREENYVATSPLAPPSPPLPFDLSASSSSSPPPSHRSPPPPPPASNKALGKKRARASLPEPVPRPKACISSAKGAQPRPRKSLPLTYSSSLIETKSGRRSSHHGSPEASTSTTRSQRPARTRKSATEWWKLDSALASLEVSKTRSNKREEEEAARRRRRSAEMTRGRRGRFLGDDDVQENEAVEMVAEKRATQRARQEQEMEADEEDPLAIGHKEPKKRRKSSIARRRIVPDEDEEQEDGNG